jgi:hypothetical protein
MKMLERGIPLSHAKRGRASANAIERILGRLEQYRCESCGQICIVPHVRILADSPGSRPVCKPQVPPATGFSASDTSLGLARTAELRINAKDERGR